MMVTNRSPGRWDPDTGLIRIPHQIYISNVYLKYKYRYTEHNICKRNNCQHKCQEIRQHLHF